LVVGLLLSLLVVLLLAVVPLSSADEVQGYEVQRYVPLDDGPPLDVGVLALDFASCHDDRHASRHGVHDDPCQASPCLRPYLNAE
jgi:hypothetical protein